MHSFLSLNSFQMDPASLPTQLLMFFFSLSQQPSKSQNNILLSWLVYRIMVCHIFAHVLHSFLTFRPPLSYLCSNSHPFFATPLFFGILLPPMSCFICTYWIYVGMIYNLHFNSSYERTDAVFVVLSLVCFIWYESFLKGEKNKKTNVKKCLLR